MEMKNEFYVNNFKEIHSILKEKEESKINSISQKYNINKVYYNLDGHDIFKRSKLLFNIF